MEKAAAITEAVAKAQAVEREAVANLSIARKRLTGLQEKEREKTNALRAARISEEHRQSFLTRITALKTSLAAAEVFENAEAGVAMARAEVEKLIAEREMAQHLADAALERFEEAERNLSEAQALHLASKLAPGEPCPVCVATEHPAPVTGMIEHFGRDQAFCEARAAW